MKNSFFNRKFYLVISFFPILVFTVLSSLSPATAEVIEDGIIPVSSGISLTIFERTGEVNSMTFPVASLLNSGAEFVTRAGEKYTLTSDGTFLTVHCYYDKQGVLGAGAEEIVEPAEGLISPLPFDSLLGYQAGNNIVAVRLDGLPEFPGRVWASFIVDCKLGREGIAETRFNLLGDILNRGPYGRQLYTTFLGKEHSEIILGFSPLYEAPVEATIEVEPNPLNLDGEWNYLEVHIELPEGHEPGDIDFSTIKISKAGNSEVDITSLNWSQEIGDYNDNGISDATVKFDRYEINEILTSESIILIVTGNLSGGTSWRGAQWIIIEKK